MKLAAVSLIAIAATLSSLHAGSFGGPRPFTNGSPLISGVDGSYQANARGTNTTGVIRFAYSGGNQTSSATANSYVIFSEGFIFSGSVAANITGSTITGALEYAAQNTFDVTGSGYFNAKIDPQSPVYSFKGTGFLQAFIQDPDDFLWYSFFGREMKVSGIRNSQES
jgi:hypothetical protein